MFRRIARRLGTLSNDDRGIALPVVIGVGLVMLMLVASSMSVVAGGVRKTNTDEEYNGAGTAAYAGIEEYQSRLANDATYYRFGNPAAAFSATSASLLTLPTGTNYNPAFNIAAGADWATIPGSTDASFRYEVDTSQYSSMGTIHLRSTGKVGAVTRTLVADLRQNGFIDFLYFTDYETTDPILSSTYKNQINATTGKNVCEVHVWEVPTRPSGCGTINFGKFDALQGPVHSNDTMSICGATFYGPVTTSSTSKPIYTTPGGCNAATFKVGTGPTYTTSLDMPPTNSQLKKETRNDLPSDVPRPGCLYTGPTVITFSVVGGVGKMRVVSPYTKKTQVAADNTGTTPAMCGKISDLQSTTGALIDVLDSNLVFVQSVPSVSTDPNYWAPNTTPVSGYSCTSTTSGGGSTVYSGGWSFGSYAYPVADEVVPVTSQTDTPAYSCRNGDLYVSGTMAGSLTAAADNYVYVTGDIKYNSKDSDILGLVGQNAIWVYNPIACTAKQTRNGVTTCTAYGYLGGASNREIDAALLSVAHTFAVQNFDGGNANLGSRGTLTVLGAIAQKFRGTVATSDGSGNIASGYAKNYQYDTRFRYTAPPKFLTPVSTTYGVTQYSGVKDAYNADGSPNP